MPTGYTAKIADGISFEEFLLSCAKAFGACVTMRDDDLNTPIPEEFRPSDYHKKEIAIVKCKLKRLETLKVSDIEKLAEKQYQDEIKLNKKMISEANSLRKKYEAMLEKVNSWVPPTPEHENLKNFMIQQITESIDFDCDTEYYLEKKFIKLPWRQWLKEEKQMLQHDLVYHMKKHREEIERVEGRNKWIKELRMSLPSKKEK